ncbi:hypothetical protein C8R46DRAFT_1031415 [Mycena filopes]|nr:hypothetical protein C8R46DRAFT_1031415 [Mycena filopes]
MDGQVYNGQGGFSTLIFDSEKVIPWDNIKSLQGLLTLPSMNSMFQNVFQALYHLVRLELGIVVENQIFNSRVMFNESVVTVYPPSSLPVVWTMAANRSRAATSNVTLMKEWADTVHFFNTTDRVPVISYLRPVPHLKPLGSALTSVFVSTFAMVSVLWTIFSLLARIIAMRFESPSTERTALSQLADCLDTHGIAIARMEPALRKQGLFEDDEGETWSHPLLIRVARKKKLVFLCIARRQTLILQFESSLYIVTEIRYWIPGSALVLESIMGDLFIAISHRLAKFTVRRICYAHLPVSPSSGVSVQAHEKSPGRRV